MTFDSNFTITMTTSAIRNERGFKATFSQGQFQLWTISWKIICEFWVPQFTSLIMFVYRVLDFCVLKHSHRTLLRSY